MIFQDTSNTLVSKILGRNQSWFHEAIQEHTTEIQNTVQHSRILVIGAAGAVGNAFVNQIIKYQPHVLHLIDINENGLVEVVRDIRSSLIEAPKDFQTLAVDVRNNEFHHFIENSKPYDLIFNFSALKHVRSERDPYTLMRLLDTNVLALDRLLQCLKTKDTSHFFSVSTDKSVNPANLMGASKAMMEQVMCAHSEHTSCTSARFANVAFSAGSLLEGFQNRLLKKQPIAAPKDIRRYFLSHEEAGHLCLIAGILGQNNEIFVPGFKETNESKTFSEIAILFLKHHGLEPLICQSEEEALHHAEKLKDGETSKYWPCFFSVSDTPGEKEIEEFFFDANTVDYQSYQNIGVVKSQMRCSQSDFSHVLKNIESMQIEGNYDIKKLSDLVKTAVPDFLHVTGVENLDAKM